MQITQILIFGKFVLSYLEMNIFSVLTPKKDIEYLLDDFSIRQALEKMDFHRFGTVPVISKLTGHYLYSLSEGDFLWYWKQKKLSFDNFSKLPLSVIEPSREFHSANAESQVEDLIPLISAQNFVPVVDDQGVFIGLVTRQRIINYLMSKDR
jgi:CBS-domain-containing membrane protein